MKIFAGIPVAWWLFTILAVAVKESAGIAIFVGIGSAIVYIFVFFAGAALFGKTRSISDMPDSNDGSGGGI